MSERHTADLHSSVIISAVVQIPLSELRFLDLSQIHITYF